jgi:flagellar FliL protein
MSAVMAQPAADAAPIRRPRTKLIVLSALVLALVLALAAGVLVFLKQRSAHMLAAAGEDEAVAEQSSPAHIDPKSVPIYLPLDPFIVNLADREADRYAQIGITLELDSNMSGEQIKAYMPAIRNAILLILANKTSTELLSRAGKEQLAQEIMREAVRPLGIELAAPEPITPAPGEHATSAAAAASGAAAAITPESASTAKPKAPRRHADMRNPILHVNFSSFIIQ